MSASDLDETQTAYDSNTDLSSCRNMFGQLHLGEVAFPNGFDQSVFSYVRFISTSAPRRNARVGIVISRLKTAKKSRLVLPLAHQKQVLPILQIPH